MSEKSKETLVANVRAAQAAYDKASDELYAYMEPLVKKTLDEGGDAFALVFSMPECPARYRLWRKYFHE